MEFSTHTHSRASDIKRDDDRPRVILILAVCARALALLLPVLALCAGTAVVAGSFRTQAAAGKMLTPGACPAGPARISAARLSYLSAISAAGAFLALEVTDVNVVVARRAGIARRLTC